MSARFGRSTCSSAHSNQLTDRQMRRQRQTCRFLGEWGRAVGGRDDACCALSPFGIRRRPVGKSPRLRWETRPELHRGTPWNLIDSLWPAFERTNAGGTATRHDAPREREITLDFPAGLALAGWPAACSRVVAEQSRNIGRRRAKATCAKRIVPRSLIEEVCRHDRCSKTREQACRMFAQPGSRSGMHGFSRGPTDREGACTICCRPRAAAARQASDRHALESPGWSRRQSRNTACTSAMPDSDL